MENQQQVGTVKFFNMVKGFGFICPDNGNRDVFVHISQLSGCSSLEENDRVCFMVVRGKKGNEANAVKKIGE